MNQVKAAGVTIEPSRRMRAKDYPWEHDIQIALPPSYGKTDQRFPVLWVTDGSLLFQLATALATSCAHQRIRSYALFLALQRSKGALQGMVYSYAQTYDDTQPALVLQVSAQELRVSYSYGASAWRCSGPTGQVSIPEILVKFMEEHGFTESRG